MSYEPAPPPYDPETPRPPSGPPYSPVPYGYQQPPYGYPLQPVIVAQTVPTSGVATASMVLGILGAVGGWCMLGIPCLIAILLGHAGLAATKDGSRGGRGMAVTGLVLGYIFVVPWAMFFFFGSLGALLSGDPTPTPTP